MTKLSAGKWWTKLQMPREREREWEPDSVENDRPFETCYSLTYQRRRPELCRRAAEIRVKISADAAGRLIFEFFFLFLSRSKVKCFFLSILATVTQLNGRPTSGAHVDGPMRFQNSRLPTFCRPRFSRTGTIKKKGESIDYSSARLYSVE